MVVFYILWDRLVSVNSVIIGGILIPAECLLLQLLSALISGGISHIASLQGRDCSGAGKLDGLGMHLVCSSLAARSHGADREPFPCAGTYTARLQDNSAKN